MVLFRFLRAQSPPSVFGPGGTLFRSHSDETSSVTSFYSLATQGSVKQLQCKHRAETHSTSGQRVRRAVGGLCLRYFLVQLGCEARFLVQVEGASALGLACHSHCPCPPWRALSCLSPAGCLEQGLARSQPHHCACRCEGPCGAPCVLSCVMFSVCGTDGAVGPSQCIFKAE